MKKCLLLMIWAAVVPALLFAQEQADKFSAIKSRPIVNQAGYNLGEAKRFVCYGAASGTEFMIIRASDRKASKPERLFTGYLHRYAGDFTGFNPSNDPGEYIIRVSGYGDSHPFWIADHLMEKLSSRLGYQFFIDVRGSEDPIYSNEAKVAGGGPSRDGGAYTLETIYEILLYASNPALFHRWHEDFGGEETPDLLQLILWHAEFAFHHRDYNGPTGYRPYAIGHPDEELQNYDYQNTLDHLAAVCAAYHSFLKPYLDEDKYRRYRQACLQNWEAYERDQVVRYWVRSDKWIDIGWQEFNEMGNVFGQSVFRNLFMYLSERNEPDGEPERFLAYARRAARDIIDHWDFENPRHMWFIRNGEHLTPQALAFFLMVAPESAPYGTREKLAAWRDHMKERTDNFWHYRKHSETEWAHDRTKELGNTGLGGSMFAVAHLLDDPELRARGWSQVNQVFGLNPAQAHYSNKSQERVEIGGYWEGVETGWPIAHPDGAGQLGRVRGTLDGTPLDNMFPYQPKQNTEGVNRAYATEGWAVSNRSWLSTIVFSTLGSHQLRLLDADGEREISVAKKGASVMVELKAALNLDWSAKEEGWVLAYAGDAPPKRVKVVETGENTGVFRGLYTLDHPTDTAVRFVYGFLGFEQSTALGLE